MKRLSQPEFIALVAMIMASVAFAVDAMLPALQTIAADLTPAAPNKAQLLITSFMLGMAIGTLFSGPISDRFGRRPVVLFGFALYFVGAGLALIAPTLELVLVARVIQGLGAAGPRIAVLAIVRDMFDGRNMARIMSFAMMIFTLVPAAAPMLGAFVMAVAGWRGIFVVFMMWAVLIASWFALRQPETLPREKRRPLRAAPLFRGVVEILSNRTVALSIAAQSMIYGILLSTLSSVQPIFDVTFDAAASFPYWFGGISLIAAGASLLNARVVMMFGMRAVVRQTLIAELAMSAAMVGIVLAGGLPGVWYFVALLIWVQSIVFMLGLTIGNLNALAMDPLGHLAGLGASVVSAVATLAGVVIALPIGLAFNGTPLNLALGTAFCCTGGLVLLQFIRVDPEVVPPAVSPTDPAPNP